MQKHSAQEEAGPTYAVCIHGAGGGGWEYDRWEPVWAAAGYTVIAPDLQPTASGLTATYFEDYLAQVQGWLPTDGALILVGASLGGILALKLAATVNPAALVLINSVPPAGVGPTQPARSYPPIVEWVASPLEETRTALFDSDEATVHWAWSRWRNESGAVLNSVAGGIHLSPPPCPTLVVLGEQDTDIPPQSGLALAAWARADVHLYHGMSHVGPLLSRRAAEVAQMAVAWCQQRNRHQLTR